MCVIPASPFDFDAEPCVCARTSKKRSVAVILEAPDAARYRRLIAMCLLEAGRALHYTLIRSVLGSIFDLQAGWPPLSDLKIEIASFQRQFNWVMPSAKIRVVEFMT